MKIEPNIVSPILQRIGAAVLLVGAVILIGLSLSSCGPTCKQGAARCSGLRAELCDSAGKWRLVADCSKVKPEAKNWRCCCPTAKRCACYPGEESPK